MVILVPPFNRCQDDFEYFSGYFHYLHFIRWQQWLPVNKNEKILKVGVGKLCFLPTEIIFFCCQSLKGLIILMDAMNDFWLRQIRKFTRFFTSFYTPYFILNMRQTKWDEMILRRIDDYEGVKTRYSAVLGVKPARVYIGGEFIHCGFP